MANKSHVADSDSDKPTHAQLAELHRQIAVGKITREKLQSLLGPGPHKPNLFEAKAIMGKSRYFGPSEWYLYTGRKFSLVHAQGQTPEIPWTNWELKALKNHFLFLSVDVLAGKPLDWSNWMKILKFGKQPKIIPSNWNSLPASAREPLPLRWYLMKIGPMESQIGLEYEVADTFSRVTANILYYFHNHVYLDPYYWVRTSDIAIGGSSVYIRGTESGIAMYQPTGVNRDPMSVAISRVLPTK